MNRSVTQAATVTATYIASGFYPQSADGASKAIARASQTCGLVLGPLERAQATAAVFRQQSLAA